MAINTLMPKSHYSRWALSLKVGDCKPWNPGRRGLELWGFPWINIIWWRCGRCNDGQEFTKSLSKALSWSHRLRGTAGKLMARFQYQQRLHWFERKKLIPARPLLLPDMFLSRCAAIKGLRFFSRLESRWAWGAGGGGDTRGITS